MYETCGEGPERLTGGRWCEYGGPDRARSSWLLYLIQVNGGECEGSL